MRFILKDKDFQSECRDKIPWCSVIVDTKLDRDMNINSIFVPSNTYAIDLCNFLNKNDLK